MPVLARPQPPGPSSNAEPAPVVALRACFADPIFDVINFLNEIAKNVPAAISFAPGRPADAFFDRDLFVNAVSDFVAARVRQSGFDAAATWRDVGQYSRTNGVIGEFVAAHLEQDERIDVDAASIAVTVGAHEAMAIVLLGLFEPGADVLLTSDPTYVGITGLARLFGIRVVPVPTGMDGL